MEFSYIDEKRKKSLKLGTLAVVSRENQVPIFYLNDKKVPSARASVQYSTACTKWGFLSVGRMKFKIYFLLVVSDLD